MRHDTFKDLLTWWIKTVCDAEYSLRLKVTNPNTKQQQNGSEAKQNRREMRKFSIFQKIYEQNYDMDAFFITVNAIELE